MVYINKEQADMLTAVAMTVGSISGNRSLKRAFDMAAVGDFRAGRLSGDLAKELKKADMVTLLGLAALGSLNFGEQAEKTGDALRAMMRLKEEL